MHSFQTVRGVSFPRDLRENFGFFFSKVDIFLKRGYFYSKILYK